MTYLISSGWWCSEVDTRQHRFGNDIIRTAQFHKLWHQSIDRYTDPTEIFIIDSASPIKPESTTDPRLRFLSLRVNGKHATDCLNKYSGWTRAVLLGLQYALVNEYDYYIYVEQDALLYGEGIIEHAISTMTTPVMLGRGHRQPIQQSLFIVRRDGIEKMIRAYCTLPYTDREVTPEVKFAYALSSFVPKLGLPPRHFAGLLRRSDWVNPLAQYCLLPFGYGRDRPIKFSDRYYYLQHASQEELLEYLDITGFAWP